MKRIVVFLLCMLMLANVFTGCTKQETNTTTEPITTTAGTTKAATESTAATTAKEEIKDEVKIGVIQNPVSMDPQFDFAYTTQIITKFVYETLINLNVDTLEIEPSLAESWDVVSPTEYVFHLRKGIKFHDGSDLDAADVKYTLERAASMPKSASMVSGIKSVDIMDDYTVKIILSAPSAVFLNNLTNSLTYIIPENSGDAIADNPIGTGPYKFTEWLVDNKITLTRFDDYWNGPKPTKLITIRIIPEHASRIIALEAGDIDVAHNLQGTNYTSLIGNDDVVLLENNSVTVEYMGFNMSKAPFDDIHVRRAVSYAINKQAYIDGIFNGQYKPARSFIVEGALGYNDEVVTCEYDFEKAKEELAKSKYPDGFKFTCYSTKSRSGYAQMIQYDLSQIGIDMTFEVVSSVQPFLAGGYTGAFITGMTNGAMDPDAVYNYLHSSTIGSGNYFFYNNTRVDEILDSARIELDPAKRASAYKEMQQIIADDIPMVPLHNINVVVGVGKNVRGIKVAPTTLHYYADVYCLK